VGPALALALYNFVHGLQGKHGPLRSRKRIRVPHQSIFGMRAITFFVPVYAPGRCVGVVVVMGGWMDQVSNVGRKYMDMDRVLRGSAHFVWLRFTFYRPVSISQFNPSPPVSRDGGIHVGEPEGGGHTEAPD